MRNFLPCLLGLYLLPSAHASELQAGAAKIDITPPIGHPMWGYASRKDAGSVGVRDRLFARALVLQLGKQRLALVSLDLGRAPSRASTNRIQTEARTVHGIDTVLMVASHTHHGPVLELDTWPDRKNPWTRTLEQSLLRVLKDAVAALQPAQLGTATNEITFNRNRHSKLARPPVDRELLLLRVENQEGKPIAHAVNFAAHPTMLPAKLHEFSADWPGAMAAYVEQQTRVPCLFLQGAAGDLTAEGNRGRDPDTFGRALGIEVLNLVKRARCRPLTNDTLQVREDQFTFPSRVDLSNTAVKAAFAWSFFPDLIEFYEHEYKDGIRPRLTTVLLDGHIGFVAVSGEFFCEHALQLKRRARLEHLFFLGYCNDYQQYFPTIEAAGEGGYGGDAPMAPAEVGAGEQIVNRALVHLYRMRGRMPDLPPRGDK